MVESLGYTSYNSPYGWLYPDERGETMKNTYKLTEGAIVLTIYAVLLMITTYVPVIGILLNFFLPLPFMFYAAKNNRKSIAVFFVAAIFISVIAGTFFSIPVTIAYGLTGLVIGDRIREKKSRLETFIAGTLAYLFTVILIYAAAVLLFNINFIEQFMNMMEESVEASKAMIEALGQDAGGAAIEQFEAGLQTVETLMPSLIVIASGTIVLIIQLAAYRILKRFGIAMVESKPFRDLSFPKSLIWYYILAILASFVIQPEEGSFWFLALLNIIYILQFAMTIQGVSFVFYYINLKGLPNALPIICIIIAGVIGLLPILLYIMQILGIIDLGVGLRQRLKSRNV